MPQKLLYSSPVYMYDHILDGPSQQNDKFQIFKTEVSGIPDQNPNMKDIDDLGKFSQIICELHNLHQLSWLDEYPTIERVLKKTKRNFHIIHIHANNVGWVAGINGIKVPVLREVSFARHDLVKKFTLTSDLRLDLDSENDPSKPPIDISSLWCQRQEDMG